MALVDQIARELQTRFTFTDIDVYLKSCGVSLDKPTSGANSKWVYSKEILTGEPEKTLLSIAEDLELPTTYAVMPDGNTREADFWEKGCFKLFLSHLSKHKKQVASLQSELRKFGISAFVAHVDIEPTREWVLEIESGLASMEALAAILHKGFHESDWTDQEIGYALGRGVFIIPLIRDANPYGFFGKYQGLYIKGKKASVVAEEIYQLLVKSPLTHTRVMTCLVDSALQSTCAEDAIARLSNLDKVENLPDAFIDRLQSGASTSAIASDANVLEKLNTVLVNHGKNPVGDNRAEGWQEVDDIPF